MQIFRTKTTSPDDFCETGLKRCLSAFDLTFLGIGAIIGTGIFVLTGIAAATQAGPAVVLSFVVAGIACAFAALAYSELASAVGGCGSAYGYSYAAFGELVAWIIGWDLLLEYGVATAAVANGWAGYFNNALTAIGFGLPEALTKAPSLGGIVNLPAAGIVLVLMALLAIGVRQSTKINTAMVFVKLLTITVFIGVAVFHINPENWSPFMPFGWSGTSPEGKPVGVLAGAAMVFFAYVGFDAVSTAAEEAKNPQRDVPIGIIASLVFCTIIYIVVSGLLTGIVPYGQLNVPSPVTHSLQLIGINWASALVATGVIAGIWAEKFDQLAGFQNFIILPLSFLSGVFYSIHSLPGFWQKLSHFNPFFYMIDGFRYGFFGVSDIAPWLSLLVVGISLAAVSGITLLMLKTGYKLRD